MHKYKCEWCGREKEAKYKSHIKRFCSHKCANEYRWSVAEKQEIEIKCSVCGENFRVKKSDHRIKEGKEIQYCSYKCAGIAKKTGAMVRCKQCGKEFYATKNVFCSPHCSSEYRSENTVKKVYGENGYRVHHVRGYNKRGNAKEHRLIMEAYLGRRLDKDEVVHHINGIRSDNRLENLQVMTRGEHSRYHREQEKVEGKDFFTRIKEV